MSGLCRLVVFMTPSPLDGLWRTALSDAARAAGWACVDAGDPTAVVPDQGACLILTPDPRLAAHVALAEWVVLADTPQNGVAATAALLGEGPPHRHTLVQVAARLAAAADMAGRGAVVLDAARATIAVPYLGEVTRAPGAGRSVVAGDGAPLAIFGQLPPQPGAAATWAPACFDFTIGLTPTGGLPEMDLTGRGRILMHGPYFDLPPGLWRATLRVAVDPEGGYTPLRFEWGVDQDVEAAYPVVTEPGVYEIALDRLWAQTGAAQVRIWVAQGVFQGRFEFLSCTVQRLPDPAPVAVDAAPIPAEAAP